jgi:hypothetical protein
MPECDLSEMIRIPERNKRKENIRKYELVFEFGA